MVRQTEKQTDQESFCLILSSLTSTRLQKGLTVTEKQSIIIIRQFDEYYFFFFSEFPSNIYVRLVFTMSVISVYVLAV